MLQQILKTIRHYKMFEPGQKVVVAVSGGPDSVALLHALGKLNMQLCLKLCVAHLDHNLRRDSGDDLLFAKKLSQALHLPFYGETIDWKKEKCRGSLEDCLKRLRYGFFLKAAKRFGAKSIALGHTRDDQAETVLMRVLRGSGLYGLSAILPRRALGPVEVVRPLIEVSREEVLKFLKKNKLPFRTDSTNADEKFTRNRIRHSLLPLLEKEYNANIKEVLSSLALLIGADYRYLQDRVEGFLKKNVRRSKNSCAADLAALKKLDISLQRLALRNILESVRGDLRRLTFKHWQEIEDLVFCRPVASEVHLPGGITVSKTKGYLNIFKR